MSLYNNPFPSDPDRRQLWDMLVEQDIEAFITSDWGRVQDDFLKIGFTAIDAQGSDNPDTWKVSFQTLAQYQASWLDQSRQMRSKVGTEPLRQALIAATTLRDIEIEGNSALLHKKFDGQIVTNSGEVIPLHWQTLYQCIKLNEKWKIGGFVGYLPLPMGSSHVQKPPKQLPAEAAQHSTAGPYSPLMVINPGQLVVISGQAALDDAGAVIGTTIEEQTEFTLRNCAKQLATAGCSLQHVFKTNVYLSDINQWDAFNSVYSRIMPEPRPVRTTVQARLLAGLLIEIEMWAVKA
ncbi:MAG: RidA family protein [Anaerolineae bacterium]|nr:RidA family protein [Anaerolineae bacterium]